MGALYHTEISCNQNIAVIHVQEVRLNVCNNCLVNDGLDVTGLAVRGTDSV